jgi:hypothetical protein
LVFKEYTTLDAVDDDLNVASVDVSEVVAVCKTQDGAEALRAEFQAQHDSNVKNYSVYPVRYFIGQWDVEK